MPEENTIILKDVFGHSISFESLEGFERFVEAEEKAWAWLELAAHDPQNMSTVTTNAFSQMRTWVNNVRNEQWTFADITNHLPNVYAGNQPNALLSDHNVGGTVQLIREEYGEDEGEIAFALAANRSNWDPTDNLRAARIWNMLANPALIGPNGHIEEHRRKMGSLRASLTKVINQAEEEHRALVSRHAENLRTDRKRYLADAVKMASLGARRADRIGSRANQSIDRIDATDRTFTLRMGLEAPVRYWRTKQKQHDRAWKVWGAAVIVYLMLVGIIVACVFPSIWKLVPVGEALSGRHLLLVTSIGASLTLIFWVARLLIRIFLGERHLATDAEERRVMTQAYLALVKAGGATDAERSIILASLFRGAQDGIVREDTTQDFSLPAMLSKALDSRRTS